MNNIADGHSFHQHNLDIFVALFRASLLFFKHQSDLFSVGDSMIIQNVATEQAISLNKT